MEWRLRKVEYEGLPLHLRAPAYANVKQYQSINPYLVFVSHKFEKVLNNGLPESEYNKSLIDFDDELIHLLGINGIPILIGTYGGFRNYWFYAKEKKVCEICFKELLVHHKDKTLEFEIKSDEDWDFINNYPFEIYN